MKSSVEAVLFSSGRPLSTEFMKEVLQTDKRTLNKALQELRQDYENLGGAVYLTNDGEMWKMAVRSQYTEVVRKVVSDIELSFQTLETLAVIAYKNPVLQSDVVQVRGTNSYEHIGELLQLKFIKKDREGRSYRLYLTEKFFEYFDLEGGKNIREVFKALQDRQEKIQKKKAEVVEQDEETQEQLATNRSGEEILGDVDKKLADLGKKLDELDEAKKENLPAAEESTEEELPQEASEVTDENKKIEGA